MGAAYRAALMTELQRDDMSDQRLAVLERLRAAIRNSLSFAFDEYGFAESEATVLYPGVWINLRNATTEISINFEYGSGLWINLGRLVTDSGRIVVGERHNLNYLLKLRAPHLVRPIRMKDFDDEAVTAALRERGTELREYAADILGGDFSIFPALMDVRHQMTAQRNERGRRLD